MSVPGDPIIAPPKHGGPRHHRPGCQCFYCLSGAREKEALNERAGESDSGEPAEATENPEVLNADLPDFVIAGRDPRSRIAQWIEYKTLNPRMTNGEIAEQMGLAVSSLNTIISRARRAGWLKFEDPMSRLEHEIIPKTIENLGHFLDKKDKYVTVETAKGTVFPQFKEKHGLVEQPTTVLALKIETAPRSDGEQVDATVITGKIVGAPRHEE